MKGKRKMCTKLSLENFFYATTSSAIIIYGIDSLYRYFQPRIIYNCLNVPCNQSYLTTYTQLDSAMVKYLKELEINKVLEMCAGTGENSQEFRRAGFDVTAYDLHTLPDEGILYGISGTVEDLYPNHMLYLGSGIDAEKSVSKFIGKYVLIGGWCDSYIERKVDVIKDMSKPEEIEIVYAASGGTAYENRGLTLDCRPGYQWMVDNGFRIVKVWIIASEKLTNWDKKMCIQQLWMRD